MSWDEKYESDLLPVIEKEADSDFYLFRSSDLSSQLGSYTPQLVGRTLKNVEDKYDSIKQVAHNPSGPRIWGAFLANGESWDEVYSLIDRTEDLQSSKEPNRETEATQEEYEVSAQVYSKLKRNARQVHRVLEEFKEETNSFKVKEISARCNVRSQEIGLILNKMEEKDFITRQGNNYYPETYTLEKPEELLEELKTE